MIPTAEEMADAVWGNAKKLLDANILEESSRNVALRLRSFLKGKGSSRDWQINVPRDDGFIFRECITTSGIIYRPLVSVDGIVTNSAGARPFSKLDVSLQLTCINDANFARWHFDMANLKSGNVYQHGPMFHMQFGGHIPNVPKFWIDKPRWAHAPMDLVLLLEAVAANFYTDEWNSELRQDSSWCEYISQSEAMCLSNYISELTKILSLRSKTVLGSFWANPE